MNDKMKVYFKNIFRKPLNVEIKDFEIKDGIVLIKCKRRLFVIPFANILYIERYALRQAGSCNKVTRDKNGIAWQSVYKDGK